MESQFSDLPAHDAARNTEADAFLAQVKAQMTDQTMIELVSAGIVKATDDKAKAAAIVSGILAVAKKATAILGL